MFAVDTSTFIAYFHNESGKDVEIVEKLLEQRNLLLPPVVLTELLSDPLISHSVKQTLQRLPQLLIEVGFWQRAGEMRAKLLSKKLKARLADTLIAQSCLDYDATLITRDGDFRHFKSLFGLNLLP